MNSENANNDPFMLKALEHWLDSANELGYQPYFCELLHTKGYVLKYAIKNTNFEYGKDVVAIAPNGKPCAFQLKGGNISLTRWRDEVKKEIEVLIDCPIDHPGIDKSVEHESYLVTNGYVKDEVKTEIDKLNQRKWKDSPLNYWDRGDLLGGFQSMIKGILPSDASSYKQLVDLIFADGEGLSDTEKTYQFISLILHIDMAKRNKSQRSRDISAALLYGAMISEPFMAKQNHYSAVSIMTVLLSQIFHLVDKYELEGKYWKKSYEIVWGNILRSARLLEAELDGGALERFSETPNYTHFASFRKHAASSLIDALKLSEKLSHDDRWKSVLSPSFTKQFHGAICEWGEASLLPMIFIGLVIRKTKFDGQFEEIMGTLLTSILENNGRDSKNKSGLMSTYYNLDFAVKLFFEVSDEDFNDSFYLSSYLLKPIIEIMARSEQRQALSEKWAEISFIRLEEFVFSESIDFYLWRAEDGENRTTTPKKLKSWSELRREANDITPVDLPQQIKRYPEFLPFFLLAFPHRANSSSLGYIDKELAGRSE